MLSRLLPAVEVIAADRESRLPFHHRAPAHEMRALPHELLEAQAVFEKVAVAEQDDAVRLAAVLVVDVPIARLLLERHKQVVPALRARARDGAKHRKEERIDQRVVRRRILEQQQRQRVRVLAAQIRSVLVDLVVELLRNRLDARRVFSLTIGLPRKARDTVGCDTRPDKRYQLRWACPASSIPISFDKSLNKRAAL